LATVVVAGGQWWWWAALVVVVADLVVVVGGGGGQGSRLVGPLPWNCFFYEISFAESFSIPGTRVTSGSDVALGKGLFAGIAVPRALCRELPLSRSCAEWKPSCAERHRLPIR
jgi:hypothetical protein